MDPIVFNNMRLEQKEAMLRLAGNILDLRYEPKFTVYLYQMLGVRVEAYYHHRDGLITAEAVSDNHLDLYKSSGTTNLGLRFLFRAVGLPV